MSTLKIIHTDRREVLRGTFEFDIQSETGLLSQVLVHTPGQELELVSPETREDLLFEDILFVGRAQKEHQIMCSLFEKVSGSEASVYQVGQLLRESFDNEAARHEFVDQLCQVSIEANLQAFDGPLKRLSPEELHQFALTGVSPLPLYARPVPNLYFTRDVAAVVHDHIVLSHPARAARARESVIMNVILRHHPGFKGLRDRIITLPPGVNFEGGDLLVVSPKVVLIGHSERTSFGGVMTVARALFERTPIEHVVMVDLPKRRSSMHLDTVLTFCTQDECVVYPPLLEGMGNIVHFTKSDDGRRLYSEVRSGLKQTLEELLGYEVAFIPCGGNNPLSQMREQWTDGANVFAIAPGVIVGYERNALTYETLRRHGYRIVTAQALLSYHEESDYQLGEKLAIKLEGTELSRGRGGPRCMTLPLCRESQDGQDGWQA